MKTYTTEELVAKVRQIGSFNDVGAEGKDDDAIVEELNTVMYDELVPTMFRLNEEWFIRTIEVDLSPDVTHYRVPSRAVGNTVRDLWWTDGQSRSNLARLSREELPMARPSKRNTIPSAFYLEGEYIVMFPEGSTGTLVVAFPFRPGQLTLAPGYRIVTAVDLPSRTVTFGSAAPPSWTVGSKVDIHGPESGAEIRVWDAVIESIAQPSLTFVGEIDGSVKGTQAPQVGDYATAANEAAIPAIPREMHSVLAQAAACRLLEADGDSEALALGQKTLGRQLRNLDRLLDSRIPSSPKKLINKYSFLGLQRRSRGFR